MSLAGGGINPGVPRVRREVTREAPREGLVQ